MIFTISYVLFYYFIKIFFAGEGFGQENFPREKPFIVVFNHNSNFDILTLSLVVRFRGVGMGKHELFKIPILRWWLRQIGVYPIIRGYSDQEGFNRFMKMLKRGAILFVSPEGTRKWVNGRPPRPRTGFIRLAQKAMCPVVPVGILGTRDILPPGSFLPRWRKIVVKVGKPVRLESIDLVPENRDLLQEQANQVMSRVYKLLPVWARPTSPILQNPKQKDLIIE